jgi:hypothetical protein
MIPASAGSQPAPVLWWCTVASAVLNRAQQSLIHFNLMRKLIGLIAIPIGICVYTWTASTPTPYMVPAWRIGDHLVSLPVPMPEVNAIIFGAYALSCVWLIGGSKSKLFPAILACTIAYYSSMELCCAGINFIIMLLGYTVALLFAERANFRYTRLIIQALVCSCYFYSALQKLLFVQFLSGESLRCEFADGWALNCVWQVLVPLLEKFPQPVWFGTSIAVIVLEFFLSVGLLRHRTRKLALTVGSIFHALIVIFMDPFLSMFSAVMLIGYLAFLPRASANCMVTNKSSSRDVSLQAVAASLCLFFIAIFPGRVYLDPDFASPRMTFLDRTPWGFSMFLMRQQVLNVTALAQFEDGSVEKIALSQRMKSASSKNELLALAQHLKQLHPAATDILIRAEIKVNSTLVVRDFRLGSRGTRTVS